MKQKTSTVASFFLLIFLAGCAASPTQAPSIATNTAASPKAASHPHDLYFAMMGWNTGSSQFGFFSQACILADEPCRDFTTLPFVLPFDSVSGPQWSPSGDRFVIQASSSDNPGNEDILVISADGKTRANILNSSGQEMLRAWTPDGKHLLFSKGLDNVTSELWQISYTGGAPQKLMDGCCAHLGSAIVTSDGTIYYTAAPKALFSDQRELHKFQNGQIQQLTDLPVTQSVTALRLAPDETQLLYRVANALYLLDIKSGQARVIASPFDGDVEDWSSDGKRIVFTTSTFDTQKVVQEALPATAIHTLDIATGKIVTIYQTDPGYWARCVSWMPGGEKIAFESSQGAGRANIFIINADGSGLTQLTQASADTQTEYLCPAWRP